MDVSRVKLPGIEDISLPWMYRLKQRIPDPRVEDIAIQVRKELQEANFSSMIDAGARVAITVGSRGIDGLADIVRSVVEEVKRAEGQPFIVPSMGSHGGGVAAGQVAVLKGYGITEGEVGAPVISTMEVVSLGRTESGYPVYIDQAAYSAEAIIVLNRIKVHTDFTGEIESGLLKMMAIGMGNDRGSSELHQYGFEAFAQLIPEVGLKVLREAPVVLGLALVENGHDHLCKIEAVKPGNFVQREKELLQLQKRLMPRLPFNALDILFVDQMGKDISGSGLDTNIIGRAKPITTEIKLIIVSDLTPHSKGNASGMGLADIITKTFYDRIDFNVTYTNILTSGILWDTRLPLVVENDQAAIRTAIKFLGLNDGRVKISRIKDTLQLAEIEVSEALLDQVEKENKDLELTEERVKMKADSSGKLLPYPYRTQNGIDK